MSASLIHLHLMTLASCD